MREVVYVVDKFLRSYQVAIDAFRSRLKGSYLSRVLTLYIHRSAMTIYLGLGLVRSAPRTRSDRTGW